MEYSITIEFQYYYECTGMYGQNSNVMYIKKLCYLIILFIAVYLNLIKNRLAVKKRCGPVQNTQCKKALKSYRLMSKTLMATVQVNLSYFIPASLETSTKFT